jgi:hypothetical protein
MLNSHKMDALCWKWFHKKIRFAKVNRIPVLISKSKFLIIEMANELPITEIVIIQIFRKVT